MCPTSPLSTQVHIRDKTSPLRQGQSSLLILEAAHAAKTNLHKKCVIPEKKNVWHIVGQLLEFPFKGTVHRSLTQALSAVSEAAPATLRLKITLKKKTITSNQSF